MTLVKIKQLEVGQQLCADACGANGRLLLKAGATIAAKHLEIFRTWGVAEVDIVGEELNREESEISFNALPTKIKNQIRQQIKDQFQHCNLQHPLIGELITYQKVRLIKEYLDDGNKMA